MVGAVTSPLSAAGIVLDIVGAWILASAFMFKTPVDWYEQTLTLPGTNGRLYLSMALQTADAQVGAALLVVGFLGQLATNVGYAPSWLCLSLALSVGAVIAAAAFGFLIAVWRPRAVRRALALLLQMVEPSELRLRMDDWGFWLVRDAPALMYVRGGWERKSGESVGDYGRRLLGQKQWERLTGGIEPPVI